MEEHHGLTITTHMSQQVEFFHSLIYFLDICQGFYNCNFLQQAHIEDKL